MALLSSRSRSRGRRMSPVETAVGFALGGSVLAIAVPTFVREVHASRLAEPVRGLQRIEAAALAYASTRPVGEAFPPPVGPTPVTPPRGHCETDAPDAWDRPTWRALDFAPALPGEPHCFSFAFDSSLSPTKSTFRADAHGDLDGDGLTSTFEVSGRAIEGDPKGPHADPGMVVQAEIE